MATSGAKGGERLRAALQGLARKVEAGQLKVGFLADSEYDDGTPVAYVAAINEFGGTVNVPEHEVTVYRKVNAAGDAFTRNGKFVKKKNANFSTTHIVPAHTIKIPARPFFRNMIAQRKDEWGPELAQQLLAQKMDGTKALKAMGLAMKGQLQQSILDTNEPPNAASTIAKKGAAKPLVDTGYMMSRVDYQVGEK